MNLDLDEIISSVCQINLNDMSLPNIQENPSRIPATLANIEIRPLDLIPEFDGTPHKLYRFISLADQTLNQYWDTTNPESPRNNYILNSILSKLKGHAEEVINISGANSWPLIRGTLLSTFGDQRDENSLLADLVQTKQKPGEEPIPFYFRIISVLNHLTNYIHLHEERETIKQNKIITYNSQALRTLIVGLREPVQSMIRALRPQNLAEALQQLTEDSNIRYMTRQNNTPQFPRPIPKHPINPMQNQNFNRQMPFFNRPQFPQQSMSFAPQFPRGPINVQPRIQAPQRFPTNSQVFGKNNNANVWKPKQNFNSQNYAPTPMSVVGSTVRPNRPIFQNQRPQFPQQKPRFTFEELYNFENPENYQHYNDHVDTDEYSEPFTDDMNLELLYENNYCTQNFDQPQEQTELNNDENFRITQPIIEET